MSYILNGQRASKTVYIDSRDASYYTSISGNAIETGSFEYEIPEPITLDDPSNSIVVSVTSAEVPYSWYNVNRSFNNDVFGFQEHHGVNHKINISQKNHSAASLANELAAALTSRSDSSSVYHVNYDVHYNKLIFTNDSSQLFALHFDIHPFTGLLLGFTPENHYSTVSGTKSYLESNKVLNVNSSPNIYIDSNFLSSEASILSSIDGMGGVLAKIQVDKEPNNMLFYNNHENNVVLRTDRINTVRLSLKDVYNNVLDLNGKYWSITLKFSFINIYDQVGSSQSQGGQDFLRPTIEESIGQNNLEYMRKQAQIVQNSDYSNLLRNELPEEI